MTDKETDERNMDVITDDERRKIIEAAMLAQRLDAGEECVAGAFAAALAKLTSPSACTTAMMLQRLLDGRTQMLSSDNPASIQLWIDLAAAIGATVEDSVSPSTDALPPGMRTIMIIPPSHVEQ